MARYCKSENGIVYLEDPDAPSAVYSVKEWQAEQERLIIGLGKQIDDIQNQIDNQPQIIEVVESYPQDVKGLIEQYNMEIPNIDDLEAKKQEKQNLLAEITNL